MPVIDVASLSGQADPIAANDPIAVAQDAAGLEDTGEVRVPASARRRVTFEDLVNEDEIDVPDFMK